MNIMVEEKNGRTRVESWGTGHKDYTAPPGPKEQKMFILGIVFGAVLSIIGNIMVTALFRIIDKGFSIENGFYSHRFMSVISLMDQRVIQRI